MSKRILAVEGQKDNRQIIRDTLAGFDYQITEAEDGEEALAAVAKQRPNLTAMKSRAASRPIPRSDRFRSSLSPPTRWMGKNRQRERQDVMAMCPSLTARANYWRKFNSACPNRCDRLLHCIMSAIGTSRRFVATHRLGRYSRTSGCDATDPSRTVAGQFRCDAHLSSNVVGCRPRSEGTP